MADNELRVRITGSDGDLLAGEFIAVLRDTLAALSQIGRCMAERGETEGTWHIRALSMASPAEVVMEQEFPSSVSDVVPRVAPVFVDALSALESEAEMPDWLNDSALMSIDRLVGHLSDGVGALDFAVPGYRTASPSLHVAANAKTLLGQRITSYNSYGELRGILGQITVYGTAHIGEPEFTVVDPLTMHRCICRFGAEDLARVKDLLGSRVRVAGKIKFNSKDRPVLIVAESWGPAFNETGTDVLDRIHKAGINITGDLSSEEHIAKVRNGGED